MIVEKFRYFVHKVLPAIYDDSLSYYEVLNKVGVKVNEVIDAVNENTENVGEAVSAANQAVSDASTALNTANEALNNSEQAIDTANNALVVSQSKSSVLFEIGFNVGIGKFVVTNCATGEVVFTLGETQMTPMDLADILIGNQSVLPPTSAADLEYPNCTAVSVIKIVESTGNPPQDRARVYYGKISYDAFYGLVIDYVDYNGVSRFIKLGDTNQYITSASISYGVGSVVGQNTPLHIHYNTSDGTCTFYDYLGNELDTINKVEKYLTNYTTSTPQLQIAQLANKPLSVVLGFKTSSSATTFTRVASGNLFMYGSRFVVSFAGYDEQPSGDNFPEMINYYFYFKSSLTPQVKYSSITLED